MCLFLSIFQQPLDHIISILYASFFNKAMGIFFKRTKRQFFYKKYAYNI